MRRYREVSAVGGDPLTRAGWHGCPC